MDRTLFLVAVAALAVAGVIIDESYILHILILCFIWTMVVVGWDLLMGYAGVFNFAQLVFFAVGAYASGMISMQLGITPVVAMVMAASVGGIAGLLIGLPCLRLKGEYVALFTFAVHLALAPLILQGRPIGTGGSTGLMGIPPIRIGDYVMFSIDKTPWYFLSLALAAATVYVVYFVILRHKSGRAFVALRDSEDFARTLGVDDYRYKLLVFTLSAFITGMAGAMYAHYVGVVTPRILGTEFFLMIMVMLSVGGMGRFPGVIIGAFLITIGNELLRTTGQYRLLILGLLVVFTLLLLPNGLVDLGQRLKRRFGAPSETRLDH